jgi:putative ATP-dependent endonuclease of OLD family
MIADLKQNVIFAMEEPEIAIPPHTQKRVINSVIDKAAQAIFTSHSPYVLEEFEPACILVLNRKDGELIGTPAKYPSTVKPKKYKEEVRRRCEALLARRVLIVEGSTEYDTFSRIAEKLERDIPSKYSSLEGLGIAVISANSDSQIAPLGKYFKRLGKTVYAIFDKQDSAELQNITQNVDFPYESQEKGFEDLVLKGTSETALRRYAGELVDNKQWLEHLEDISPADMAIGDLKNALKKYFQHKKASGNIADFLDSCSVEEIPEYILNTLQAIRKNIVSAKDTTTEAPGTDDDDIHE